MTNKELGKKIWNAINFNINSTYSEDFELWYKDCFATCIDDAANNIFHGVCTYEKGSFIEISSAYTKSGNPETFDFDKENFIEFYGEEECKTLFNIQEEIIQKLNITNLKDFNELVWNYGASGTKIFDEYQLSNEQKEIISSAWSEYEKNNTGISEEKADEIINSYFESFINKTENTKNVELPWNENISPEMQKRIDSGEIFGTNKPVEKTENIDFSKITNPYFNLLNVEQKLAVWHDMKINVDFKGEYYDQNQETINDGWADPWHVLIPDNWLVEHINHKGWKGDYPYFNLSVEHERKHYFNDVFKEENVSFDEELLIKNIQSVKVENNKNIYTNVILDKIRAAGIEVVTDKNEFDRILGTENSIQRMTSVEYNNKEVDAFVTDKSGFVDPEKIAAIDLYGFEKAKKMWKNGEPDWETRMMLQDKSISDYLNKKTPHIYKKQIDDTVYGFVYNGKIYLNPEILNSNAAVHEYTHLWDVYTQKTNPELWGKGLELFKYTNYWNEVISEPNYQDIKNDDNLVLSEIHSRICGNIAEEILNRIAELDGEQAKLDAIDWDKETWNYIAENFLTNSYSYALFNADVIKKEDLSESEQEQYKLTKEKYNNNSFAAIVPEAVNAYNSGSKGKYLALRELADIQNNFYKEFLSTPLKDLINEKNISQDINMETIQKSTKLQNKSEVYIDLDTANEIVLDEEILLNDDKSVSFYSWSTNKLVEQFIPSEKRLQLADEDNNINFYFNYFDENNINMELSFYKGDVQVYESYKVSPESKGFDKLKEKLDEYCMEQEGIHVDDYKFLNNMTKLNSKELSDYINKNTSIAFSEEYSKKILNWFETTNKPVYKTTENEFYVYHKDYDDISRNNTYPLTNTTISGLISFCMDNLDIHDEITEKEYDDLSAVRDSLEVFEDKERLDMLYQPITPEKLMEFINIAELNTFNKEMAVECIETYKSENIPLVFDELGNVYQREMSENLKSNSEDDLTMLNPSGCIDFYKNELERISTNADEEWFAAHKHTIDELNDIEDYLVNLENTVPLTTDNAYILADYVNNNKEIFGKFFTKSNGHIPAFEDMSKELAADILETLEIGDYLVRYVEQEKKFFIYDRQAADENLFIEADAGNLISKASDISNEWHRDDTTARENEICERLDKYLYPTESYQNLGIERTWENIKHDFNDIDFENAHDRAVEILARSGIENDVFMLKQETVWQLLDSGYLTIHVDINSADIDRGWYSDTLDSLTEKYVNGNIRFDEIQNIYNIEESEYLKELFKPLDYNNPDDVKSFAAFLNNNFKLSGEDIFTPEIAKFILQYDANIDDKPDQLTLINDKLYCHSFKGNMNNPQSETPDTWELYGSGKNTVLEIIGRTLDLTNDIKLTKNEQLLQSKLNSMYIIGSFLKKVKNSLINDVFLSSQKALSNFNKDEKTVIRQFFLDNGVNSQLDLVNFLSYTIKEPEKVIKLKKNYKINKTERVIKHKKNNKQKDSYDIER